MKCKSKLFSLACTAATMTAAAHASSPRIRAQEPPPKVVFVVPQPSEMVQIEGRKNPELIPQWNAWENAFRTIATVSNVPTHVIKHISADESAALIAAAREARDNLQAIELKVSKLIPMLSTPEAKLVEEKTREINLEYRWQTLRLRDRVLALLQPEGQTALNNWVEFNKSGMTVYVPKNELEFYRQPQ